MKRLLLALCLVAGLSSASLAQSNTELAVITYIPRYNDYQIVINGTEFNKIKVPKEQVKGSGDVSFAIAEIRKMLDEGWEIVDTNFSFLPTLDKDINAYNYTLKRKKK